MPGLVEGRLALVTGGSSGIGRAACQVLAREGATVVVTCVDDYGAKATMETLPGASHSFMKFDVTDTPPVDILNKIFLEYRKYPDILVNCAGIVRFTPPLEETPETFQSIIDVNLKRLRK
ncbi:3-oxoacyl-[acyl-carrier-protein] reductase FabG-like [Macrosteles quadrilineatus]|uniref:3-oxoacyl-[acyl-carrier-protein] reductase FabG-like n=1 Tax=Macrosteles quadrilineatus TaxID=74068 RepID=UPI0023E22CE3|nr:3-oxoacyl-[acyl-carrier-protein] reductase FabG-like [Macrosteles quadrilineatus]